MGHLRGWEIDQPSKTTFRARPTWDFPELRDPGVISSRARIASLVLMLSQGEYANLPTVIGSYAALSLARERGKSIVGSCSDRPSAPDRENLCLRREACGPVQIFFERASARAHVSPW